MKSTQSIRRLASAVILAGLGAVSAFGDSATGTTDLQVTVAAEAAIVVDTATTTLTSAGIFADYTGSTSYTYKIRTTAVGGTGAVVLQITSDFSPAGGPSVATPPSVGDALTYVCSAVAPATACVGTQTSSTASATPVASFGADAHSIKAGTGGNSTTWTLTNDPVYQTGAYSATATYTISAT
jgi:hypothetical protein